MGPSLCGQRGSTVRKNQWLSVYHYLFMLFISQDDLTVADIYEDGGVAMDISVQD